MNEKQFSDRIGNIDDQLILQAWETANHPHLSPKNSWRKWISIAAIITLVICSGAAGALAFSKETIVEIAVEQETIVIEEIGLTLILPDQWKDKYALEQDHNLKEYYIYHPVIREAMGGNVETPLSGGMLFYIKLWNDQLTKEQIDAGGEWDYARCRYLMTTKDGTYLLYYASDVQFTEDTMAEYRQMEAEISTIRFVLDNALN